MPDLEAAIDALYQGSLDLFTSERNALAASLRRAGDKASADRVKALVKPSATAWAVNQVWWQQRDRFQAMLDAGVAHRSAHLAWAQGRDADVRDAAESRGRAVRDVTDAAIDLLGGKKVVAPDMQYRISGTVEALASSGVPDGEALGRLTKDLQSSGLDALSALAAAAGSSAGPTLVARSAPRPAGAGPTRPPGQALGARTSQEGGRASQEAEAQARADAMAAALAEAARAAEAAASAEARARLTLEQATTRRAELEASLDDARAAEAAARRELSQATAASSRAELDRARAVRDATQARAALERLRR